MTVFCATFIMPGIAAEAPPYLPSSGPAYHFSREDYIKMKQEELKNKGAHKLMKAKNRAEIRKQFNAQPSKIKRK